MRWLADALAEYRRHPLPALMLVVVAVAGIVLAATTYFARLDGATASLAPSPQTGVSQSAATERASAHGSAPLRPAPTILAPKTRSAPLSASPIRSRSPVPRPSVSPSPSRSVPLKTPSASPSPSPSVSPSASPEPSPSASIDLSPSPSPVGST